MGVRFGAVDGLYATASIWNVGLTSAR